MHLRCPMCTHQHPAAHYSRPHQEVCTPNQVVNPHFSFSLCYHLISTRLDFIVQCFISCHMIMIVKVLARHICTITHVARAPLFDRIFCSMCINHNKLSHGLRGLISVCLSQLTHSRATAAAIGFFSVCDGSQLKTVELENSEKKNQQQKYVAIYKRNNIIQFRSSFSSFSHSWQLVTHTPFRCRQSTAEIELSSEPTNVTTSERTLVSRVWNSINIECSTTGMPTTTWNWIE